MPNSYKTGPRWRPCKYRHAIPDFSAFVIKYFLNILWIHSHRLTLFKNTSTRLTILMCNMVFNARFCGINILFDSVQVPRSAPLGYQKKYAKCDLVSAVHMQHYRAAKAACELFNLIRRQLCNVETWTCCTVELARWSMRWASTLSSDIHVLAISCFCIQIWYHKT